MHTRQPVRGRSLSQWALRCPAHDGRQPLHRNNPAGPDAATGTPSLSPQERGAASVLRNTQCHVGSDSFRPSHTPRAPPHEKGAITTPSSSPKQGFSVAPRRRGCGNAAESSTSTNRSRQSFPTRASKMSWTRSTRTSGSRTRIAPIRPSRSPT